MDFNVSEERSMVRDTLAKFLRANYPFEMRRQIAASESGSSQKIWQQFADLGVIGALFGEESGGFGGDGDDLMVVFEALGRALVVEPVLPTAVLCGTILSSVKSGFVEDIISGQTKFALAHSEPDSRYDLAHVGAQAKRAGDQWLVCGQKSVVLGAGSADKLIVTARTAGTNDEAGGISLFMVDAMANGIEQRCYPTIDGYRAADITFTNTPMQLLGEENQGDGLLELAHARAIVAIGAECLGACEVAKEMTVEYMHTRKQFGVAIGKFQVLQHRMADLLIELEQLRSAIINAAGHLNSERIEREKSVSAAKNLVGRVGRLVAEEAIQIHGGIAMTWEADISHFAKHIVMIDHLFGDSDHHLERYVALSR